jgi:hypothetical protein
MMVLPFSLFSPNYSFGIYTQDKVANDLDLYGFIFGMLGLATYHPIQIGIFYVVIVKEKEVPDPYMRCLLGDV